MSGYILHLKSETVRRPNHEGVTEQVEDSWGLRVI